MTIIGRYSGDEAYDRHLAKQADEHFAPALPVCPWCGVENPEGEEFCLDCQQPMDGEDFYQCPYCGDIKTGESAYEGASCCKENHVELVTLNRCPECSSTDTHKAHHEGNLAAPECDYKVCECGHQWGHE